MLTTSKHFTLMNRHNEINNKCQISTFINILIISYSYSWCIFLCTLSLGYFVYGELDPGPWFPWPFSAVSKFTTRPPAHTAVDIHSMFSEHVAHTLQLLQCLIVVIILTGWKERKGNLRDRLWNTFPIQPSQKWTTVCEVCMSDMARQNDDCSAGWCRFELFNTSEWGFKEYTVWHCIFIRKYIQSGNSILLFCVFAAKKSSLSYWLLWYWKLPSVLLLALNGIPRMVEQNLI